MSISTTRVWTLSPSNKLPIVPQGRPKPLWAPPSSMMECWWPVMYVWVVTAMSSQVYQPHHVQKTTFHSTSHPPTQRSFISSSGMFLEPEGMMWVSQTEHALVSKIFLLLTVDRATLTKTESSSNLRHKDKSTEGSLTPVDTLSKATV